MLLRQNDVEFNQELRDFSYHLLESINNLIMLKSRMMDNTYRLFADVKCLVSLNEANNLKREYSTFEYCFSDFCRDVERLKSTTCREILAGINHLKEMYLSNLEGVVDSYLQFLKEERDIYRSTTALASFSFTKNYIRERHRAYFEHMDRLEQNHANIKILERAFEAYRDELVSLKQNAYSLFRQADFVLALLDWILECNALSSGRCSISGLLRLLHEIDSPDQDEANLLAK